MLSVLFPRSVKRTQGTGFESLPSFCSVHSRRAHGFQHSEPQEMTKAGSRGRGGGVAGGEGGGGVSI